MRGACIRLRSHDAGTSQATTQLYPGVFQHPTYLGIPIGTHRVTGSFFGWLVEVNHATVKVR